MSNEPSKVGKLAAYIIILRSIWEVFFHSAKIVLLSMLGCLTKAKVDRGQQRLSTNLLNIAKINWVIHDPYQIQFAPGQRYIVMSNHSSLYDIPLIMVTFPEGLRMLAKKELFRVPVWGGALRRSDYVSIDRHNRTQAVKDLEVAKEKLNNGVRLWISPEGTRSRNGQLQAFKKGGFMLALQTQAIIVPVAIKGAYEILPPKSLDFSLNKRVDIFIGKPIDTTAYSMEQRDELIQKVRGDIEQYLGGQN